MKKALFAVLFVWLLPFQAWATSSTIDTTKPEYDDDVDSYTFRALATAAANDINNLYTMVGSGVATPGGASGSTQWNNNGTLNGYVMTGDCTLVPSTGVITCLTLSGLSPFNASNISTGVLNPNQLPLPTSNTVGAVKSFSAPTHNFVNGLNTSGAFTWAQPAASDISGLAPSATTDTTNAGNISNGTLSLARIVANIFTSTLAGLVPASGGGTTNYLRADGTWAAPASGSSEDVVGGLVFNSTADATANTTAIQSALNAQGHVKILCASPSIIYVNSSLVMSSNTDLYVAPSCTITANASYSLMVENAALTTSWTTLYDSSGVVTNGPLSIIRESDITAWSTSHAFSTGNYATANGNVYWCATGGTTSSSGSGPSGTGAGIGDGSVVWNYVTSYTKSTLTYPAYEFVDAGVLAIVHWPNHGVSLGAHVWITPKGDNSAGSAPFYWSGTQAAHTAGGPADSAYFGIFPVGNVNDSNYITVVLRRAPNAAFSGIPMLIKQADQNIKLGGGGTWDYNYPTNTYGNHTGGSPIGYVANFGGVSHLYIDNLVGQKTNGFMTRLDGVEDGDISHLVIGNPGNFADGLKIFGPEFDLRIHDMYGTSNQYGVAGDDFATMNTEESLTADIPATVACGDLLSVHFDRIVAYGGLRVGMWMTNPFLFADNLEFSHIGPSSGVAAAERAMVTFFEGFGGTPGGTVGHVSIHDIFRRSSPLPNTSLVSVDAANSVIQQLNISKIDLSPVNNGDTGNLVALVAGTIGQVNVSEVTGYPSGVLINGGSGTTVKSINFLNNYILSSPTCFVKEVSAAQVSFINNYAPNDTNALVCGISNENIYVANNYVPNSTQGLVNFQSGTPTPVVSSGEGNSFGSGSWFTNGAGTGTPSVFGWDIKCDVTQVARATGEHCFNTNASPGSGTLSQTGLVADQGTGSGSWFALSNPSGQTY